MDIYDLIDNLNLFWYIQNIFCKEICDKIFENSSDHIYEKWVESNYNLLNFLSKLDVYNRLKILQWVEKQPIEYAECH